VCTKNEFKDKKLLPQLPSNQGEEQAPPCLSGQRVRSKLKEIETSTLAQRDADAAHTLLSPETPAKVTQKSGGLFQKLMIRVGELKGRRQLLLADEVVGSPGQAFSQAPAKLFSKPAAQVNCQSTGGQVLMTTRLLDQDAEADASEPPCEDVREQLNKLKLWFEQFGKDGILMQKVSPTASFLSDEIKQERCLAGQSQGAQPALDSKTAEAA
jgi:hypothetical protein